MPTLDRKDNIFVIDLGDGENRLRIGLHVLAEGSRPLRLRCR